MRDFSENGYVWWKLEAASAASLNGAFDSHAIFPPYGIKTLKLYSFSTSQCPSAHPSSIHDGLTQLHLHLKGRLIQNRNDPSLLLTAVSLETLGAFC